MQMERNALEVTHHELQRARSVESITKTTGHDASSLLDKQPQEESRTLTAASHHQEKHLPQLPKATHQALADSRAGQSSLKVLSPPLGSPKRGASTTSLWSSDDTSSDNGSPAEDDPNDVPSIIIPLRTPKSPSRGLSQSRRSPSRDTSYSRQSPSRDSEEWIHHQEALKLRRASPRRPSVPIPELQGQEPQFPHSLNARNHIEYALIYLDQAPLATAQFPAVRRALEILERALQEVEGQQQIPSDSENGGKQGGQATPETRSIPVNSLQSVFT
ncbi:hypothetical protein DFS34DRAFT_309367 [Phlyctochytrium arcticum]|nr:hypothetical protein DFS34DRAFT_309367 [Phlyctochytrium arcticum]